MTNELEILKGIHSGLVLERKIQEQHLKKGRLALECREYPQTLTAITKGKRHMNTALAIKLEKQLGLEEGYFMILQVFYDIKTEKQKLSQDKPDPAKLRRVLFWDTRMEKLNWQQQYKFIIGKIFERGTSEEKKEITRFYGQDKVDEVLTSDVDSPAKKTI